MPLTGYIQSIEHRSKLKPFKFQVGFDPRRTSMAGKTQSEKVRKRISESRIGELNPNWRGGITSKTENARRISKARNWSRMVKERSNYTCEWCGSKERLQADHIKSFSRYPELRYELENGRTLCESCHRKTDTWGGKNY